MSAMNPPTRDCHPAHALETLFADCFLERHNTRLVGGGEEPLYRPADRDGGIHCVVYRADYFASALHEVAHWCIAGAERRRLLDYGYWYCPDGRDAAAQSAFEAVEVRPQALEWIFATAAGFRFQVSLDNLNNRPADSLRFRDRVAAAARMYCRVGLPPRAARFSAALARYFALSDPLDPERYPTAALAGLRRQTSGVAAAGPRAMVGSPASAGKWRGGSHR